MANWETRKYGKKWLELNHPSDSSNKLRTSKYYSKEDHWFFTLSTFFLDAEITGNLNILLQYKDNPQQFYFLKIPFSFFRDNKSRFDVRTSGDKFDLHLSAKQENWLVCKRSNEVCFREFEQYVL